jgi:hypothetical protein
MCTMDTDFRGLHWEKTNQPRKDEDAQPL